MLQTPRSSYFFLFFKILGFLPFLFFSFLIWNVSNFTFAKFLELNEIYSENSVLLQKYESHLKTFHWFKKNFIKIQNFNNIKCLCVWLHEELWDTAKNKFIIMSTPEHLFKYTAKPCFNHLISLIFCTDLLHYALENIVTKDRNFT